MKKRSLVLIVVLMFIAGAFFYTKSMLYTTYLDVPGELDRVEEYEREPNLIATGAFDCDVVKKVRDSNGFYGTMLEWCDEPKGYYAWRPGIEGGGEGSYFNQKGSLIGKKYLPGVMDMTPKSYKKGRTFDLDGCQRIDVEACDIIDLYLVESDQESDFRKYCDQAVAVFDEKNKTLPSTGENFGDYTGEYRDSYALCTDQNNIYYGRFISKDRYKSTWDIIKTFEALEIYSLNGELLETMPSDKVTTHEDGHRYGMHVSGDIINTYFTECSNFSPEDCQEEE